MVYILPLFAGPLECHALSVISHSHEFLNGFTDYRLTDYQPLG